MPSLNTGNAILSNAIAVDSSYNVGIGGAASGSFKLQVTGTTNLTGALTGTSGVFSSSLTATAFIPTSSTIPTNGLYLPDANTLGFATNSTLDMVITAAGNVAIGGNTITDANMLNVIGNQSTVNIGVVLNNTNSTHARIYALQNVNGNFNIRDYTASSDRLSISSTGAVSLSSSLSATTALLNSTTNQLVLQNTDGGSNAEKVALFMTGGDTFKVLSLNDNNTTRVDNILVANVLSGNVGIGLAPNTWAGTNTKALQVYLGAIASSLTFGTAFTFNSYYDGSWRYTGSYSAGKYEIGGNEHIWYSAPDGTAGNVATFTERMRITSGGNVLINTTTDNGGRLQVNGVTQLRDTLILVKQTSSIYNQTSTSGTTSIVDTGIFYNTSIIGYGVSSIYQVTISGNPQNLGSGEYRNTVLGYISIQTGFNGSVVQTITWNQIFSNDGGTLTPFTISIRFWNGSSENTSVPAGSTNNQIRIKIAAYGGTVGASQDVRIIKITD
jgi:hypothetical protein